MNVATPLAPQVPLGSLPQSEESMTEDEVTRVRQRHLKALRCGMSNAEATAYANGPDLAEPSVPAGGARVELAAAPSAPDGCGGPQSHLVGDRESVATPAPLSREPTLSASTAHNEKIDADLLGQPDRVVF